MGESLQHKEFVERIVKYIEKIIPEDTKGLICADLDGYERPNMTYESYVPDVMYSFDNLFVIGEAKTYFDFARDHSEKQYRAYLNECSKRVGDTKIIISIPWELFITAKNRFRLLKKEMNSETEVIIISENGIVESV